MLFYESFFSKDKLFYFNIYETKLQIKDWSVLKRLSQKKNLDGKVCYKIERLPDITNMLQYLIYERSGFGEPNPPTYEHI